MDKKQKVVNFIKREGFYVILFVCLCVVATVAAVTAKKNVKPNTEVPVVEEQTTSDELSKNDDSSVINFDDAELVKDKQEDEEVPTVKQEPKQEEVAKDNTKEDTVATAATPSKGFINPVTNGVITRSFNFRPVLNEAKTGATVFNGVDIEAPVGSEVKSVADGTVLEATKGDSKEGYYVTVEHADGLVATYANLEENLLVKAGDNVTQGTALGKIGKTVQSNPESRVSSEYLLLEMQKANEPVNPQDYLKEIPTK